MTVKGSSMVDVVERRSQRTAEAMHARIKALKKSAGDHTAFSVPLTRQEQALRYLGMWLVLGQADAQVSGPFWDAMIRKRGPRDSLGFDRAMRRMAEDDDHEYLADALQVLSPQLRTLFDALLAARLHDGTAGKPLSERGLTRAKLVDQWEQRQKRVPERLEEVA